MPDSSKLNLIQEMLETAETSVRTAQKLLAEITGGKMPSEQKMEKYAKKAADIDLDELPNEDGDSIVEGVFDGQNMIGKNKRTYAVPANYASKSKLVAGDILKLTIKPDGAFVYKQIHPVERKRIIGTLTYEDGQYKVLTESKVYNVLLASVTYFKGEIGDKVTLIVPEEEETEWGAIENILPADGEEGSTDADLEMTTRHL